jgi:hypothetical protein
MISTSQKFFDNLKRNFQTSSFVPSLIFLITYACLIYFLFHTYINLFNSDSAAKLLLADGILNTPGFYKSWMSVNNDFWIFSTHLFVLPFLLFMKTGYTAYACGAALFTIFFISGAWLLLSKIQLKLNQKLLALSVLISGISYSTAEHLFGQFSYGVGLALGISFYLIYLCLCYLNDSDRLFNKSFFALTIGVIFFLTFTGNPHRATIYYFFPLLSAIILGMPEKKFLSFSCFFKSNSEFILILVVSASSALGWITHKYLMGYLQVNLGVTEMTWVNFSQIFTNLTSYINSIFEILGGKLPYGEKVKSIPGVYSAVRFIAALLILFLISKSLKPIFINGNKFLRFTLLFFFANTIVVSFFLITTTLNGVDRYLIPSFISILALLLSNCDITKSKLLLFLRNLTILVFLFSSIRIYLDDSISTAQKIRSHDINLIELTSYLKTNNLNFGYATFYNADAATVLSNSEIIIRHIILDKGTPKPYRWLSSDLWYLPEAHQGKTFLALTNNESKLVNWNALKSYGVAPDKVLHFENFDIYVFNENLAKSLSPW